MNKYSVYGKEEMFTCNECKTKKTSEPLMHFEFCQWKMSISSLSSNNNFFLSSSEWQSNKNSSPNAPLGNWY